MNTIISTAGSQQVQNIPTMRAERRDILINLRFFLKLQISWLSVEHTPNTNAEDRPMSNLPSMNRLTFKSFGFQQTVDDKKAPGIWQKTAKQREQGSRPCARGDKRHGEAGTDTLCS